MTTRDVIRALESYEKNAGESELFDVIILEPQSEKVRFYVSDQDTERGYRQTWAGVPDSTEIEEVAPQPKPKQTNKMQPKREYLTHDKPAHYDGMKIDVIEFCAANNIEFAAGNVVKYVCRYKRKGGVEDLRKAKAYIERMIAECEKEKLQS